MKTNKGFSDRVENCLGVIPGIGTYRKRENLRETDHNLRAYIAQKLQEVKEDSERIVEDLSGHKNFDLLSSMGGIVSQLQQTADTIKYASYGYGGIFALKKIRDEELKKLYDFDLGLIGDVKEVQELLAEMRKNKNHDFLTSKMGDLKNCLSALEKKLHHRYEFLINPDHCSE